jgi:hypothetical protein
MEGKWKVDNRNLSRYALSDAGITPPGLYFVTICVQHHQITFGHVVARQMSLNEAGIIAPTNLEHLSAEVFGHRLA